VHSENAHPSTDCWLVTDSLVNGVNRRCLPGVQAYIHCTSMYTMGTDARKSASWKPRESKGNEHFVLAEKRHIAHSTKVLISRTSTMSRWITITPPISHLPPVSLLQTLSHGPGYWFWSSICLAGASESWDMTNTHIQILFRFFCFGMEAQVSTYSLFA